MRNLAFAAILVAGCSGEPTTYWLQPGQQAVVFSDPKAPEPYDHAFLAVPKGTGFHGSGHIEVPFGSVVEVLEDQGEPTDPERDVRVRITEGEGKGRTGTIERWFLRALPAR